MTQGLTGVPLAVSRSANVASATTVTLPSGSPMDCTYPITGTNTITGITAGQAGRKARLEFQSAGCTVVNGSNLKLAGRNFVSTALRMLELVSDGTNWVEQSRGAFGSTTPTALALGGSASAGTVGEAADVGHSHGFPIPAPTIGGLLGTDGTSALWAPSGYENVLYNGGAEIAQLGDVSSPATIGARFLDGWIWAAAGAGACGITRNTAPTFTFGAGHAPLSSYQHLTVTTVDSSIAAGDVYQYYQTIEGWNARKLTGGSAFSGWFYSTRGGTFNVFMVTRSGGRSLVHDFTLPANTWTYVTKTFPAWPLVEGDLRSNIGCYFGFSLAGGSAYQSASPGNWVSSNSYVTANTTNNMDTLSAQFYMANLNLIPGLVPMPYQPIGFDAELLRARRHRQVIVATGIGGPRVGIGYSIGTTQGYVVRPLVPTMMGVPTLIQSAASHFSVLSAIGAPIQLTALADDGSSTPWTLGLLYTVGAGMAGGNATMLYASNGSAILYVDSHPT